MKHPVDPIIQVISLEKSQARRHAFSRWNQHLNFEFFSAIDGSEIRQRMILPSDCFLEPLDYAPGAYGCALSHHALWQRTVESDRPCTIAEDDAIFRLDFQNQAERFIDRLPDDWDLVLWGWNFDSILSARVSESLAPVLMLFDQAALRANLYHYQASTDLPVSYRLQHCFGTPAYTISSKGAQRYLAACFPIRDFVIDIPGLGGAVRNNGIDIVMNQTYGLTAAYVAFPPLAVTPNIAESSTINRPHSSSMDG